MLKFKIGCIIATLLLFGCSNVETNTNYRDKVMEKENYSDLFGEKLSLNEAIKIARERNLDLKAKRLEREIATLDKKIAFGNFLPSINMMAGYTKFDDPINLEMSTGGLGGGILHIPSSLETKLLDESVYTFGVGAQLPIFVPSTWYLYSARQKGEDIGELVENLTDKLIQLQVIGQYYYVLALESERKSLIDDLNSTKELEKKVKVSLKVEAVLPWELQKVQSLVKIKELAVNENARNLKIAKMNLMKSLNLNPLQDVELEKEKIDIKYIPSEIDCIYEALSSNEMLKISERQQEISEEVKKIAITNFLPKVVLGGGYFNTNNSTLSDPDFLYGNVSGVISIFNGFKNINEYKKAVRKEKIAELKLEKEFMTTVIETSRAYKNVKTAEEFLSIVQLNLKAETGRLRQKKLERKVEMISDEEYLKALSSYEEALSMEEKAMYQYEIALGTLNIAMGKNPIREEN